VSKGQTVANDINISDLAFIPLRVARSLERIEVRTARQMFHRLKRGRDALREYLQVDSTTFNRIEVGINDVIEHEFPRDDMAAIAPDVSKRGVAAHRVDQSSPHRDEDIYIPPRRRH
jgi:hypothetical protein